jgi:hypothetical protein
MSRSCDTYEEIPQNHHPHSLGLNLHSIGLDEGFDEQTLLVLLCEKTLPSPSNAWLSEIKICLNEALHGSRCYLGYLG